jgi:hypothetical protein
MSPCTPLSAASLAQIASLVRDHLAASQMFWEVVQGRTYLRCHSSVDARTVAVSQATLGELREAVPTGPSAKILRRAMTELQMLLHEKIPDPLAPNAFWLWGAGEMPQLPSRSLPPIWTNDDYARGIYRAHAANNCYPLPPVLDVILDQASEARRVVVIRDCSPSVLERDWFAPALHALNKGRLHQVDIYLDGWQVLARRSFMRRLFAPSRNLAESMT